MVGLELMDVQLGFLVLVDISERQPVPFKRDRVHHFKKKVQQFYLNFQISKISEEILACNSQEKFDPWLLQKAHCYHKKEQ